MAVFSARLCSSTHITPHLQGRGSSSALERGEAEALFREHVQGLYEAVLEAFLDLLDKEVKVCEGSGQ